MRVIVSRHIRTYLEQYPDANIHETRRALGQCGILINTDSLFYSVRKRMRPKEEAAAETQSPQTCAYYQVAIHSWPSKP